MKGLHILWQAEYKPGDQAPEGYLAWHEWAEVQHEAGLQRLRQDAQRLVKGRS